MADINALVGNITTLSQTDGAKPVVSAGRQGDLMVSEAHGKWYTAGYRGASFIGSTPGAGITVPGLLATAAKFVLHNPAGSGKNVELSWFAIGIAGTTTAVIGSLQFSVQSGVGTITAIPNTLTAGVVTANPVGASNVGTAGAPGSGLAVAKIYTAATIVAPLSFFNLGLSFGTTGAAPGPVPAYVEFDGRVILAPGTLISLESTAIQTQPFHPTLCWSEWPI